jgi:hypothetical protein
LAIAAVKGVQRNVIHETSTGRLMVLMRAESLKALGSPVTMPDLPALV